MPIIHERIKNIHCHAHVVTKMNSVELPSSHNSETAKLGKNKGFISRLGINYMYASYMRIKLTESTFEQKIQCL